MRHKQSNVQVWMLGLLLIGLALMLRQIGGVPSRKSLTTSRATVTRTNTQATMTAWGPASRRKPSTPLPRPTRTPSRGSRSFVDGAAYPYPAPGRPTARAESTRPAEATEATRPTAVVAEGIFGRQLKRMANDAYHRSYFGEAVAIRGDRAIVGAYRDGEQAENAGAAYVFERRGSEEPRDWRQVAKLLTRDGKADDWFGMAVDVEGDLAVVGAPFHDAQSSNGGAAFVFAREPGDNGSWVEVQRLTAPDGRSNGWFGMAVAIDGERIAVGASKDYQGASAGLNMGTASGTVYVFERSADAGLAWKADAKLEASDGKAGDRFGSALALQGDLLVVGAPSWSPEDVLGGPVERFGRVPAAVEQLHGGAAYVYAHEDGTWTEQVRLGALNGATGDSFGFDVDLDDDTIAVGAPQAGAGSLYVFDRDQAAGPWRQTAELKVLGTRATEFFGGAVAIAGDQIVAGARFEPVRGPSTGAVYANFRMAGGRSWIEAARLTATDARRGQAFASTLAFDGETLLVGASGDDTRAEDAGAVYFLTTPADTESAIGP